jgi:SAM-dependent methyltransferase
MAWGTLDINERQKWKAIWPSLSSLPEGPLTLLDAGCGRGQWALELAARRCGWTVVGMDRDRDAVIASRERAKQLGVSNVTFLHSDFLSFRPLEPFDVVLSVHSAHYLAAEGSGAALFEQFASWLKSGGVLLLMAPRRGSEIPESALLPRLKSRDVFGYDDLLVLSNGSGLVPERLAPVVGRLGTLAKQISQLGRGGLFIRFVSYPIQVLLDALDGGVDAPKERLSAAWFLAARRARTSD